MKNSGISGGYGDGRYHPDVRSCPGVWYTLGDGSDARPFVQQEIRHGDSGSALALSGKDIMAVHQSSPDRSLMTGVLDMAITNGKAALFTAGSIAPAPQRRFRFSSRAALLLKEIWLCELSPSLAGDILRHRR